MTPPESLPFTVPEDTERILSLLRQCRVGKHAGEYPTPADLGELLAQPAVRKDTRLWLEPDGTLTAFALVDPYDNLVFEIAPPAYAPALEEEIIGWGFSCLRRRIRSGRPLPTLDVSCLDSDRDRAHMLERNGFLRQAVHSLRLERSLSGGLPTPALPAGFHLRTLQDGAEISDWVDLHRAAHGTTFMTIEERQAMMANPAYDPELDLVITAPGGSLAAYCLCTIDAEENQRSGRRIGASDPIATHPDYRRRGLALALLLAGMDLLRERGMETTALTSTSANLSMLAAASKAGFRIVSRRFWYYHPLP